MARGPGSVLHFVPGDAIGRVPDVIAVGAGKTLQDPQPLVPHGHVVVLPRGPRGGGRVLLPGYAVGTAPDVVEIFPRRNFGRVVGAAAENPDAAFEGGAAADHAALRPERLFRLDLGPLDAVGRGPDIAVENLVGFGELRHRLAANDPDLAVVDHGVVQGPGAPGHGLVLVDEVPRFAFGRIPDVEVVVPLVHVAADDPQLVVVDRVAGRVAPFPVLRGIERAIEECVGFHQRPVRAVNAAPD